MATLSNTANAAGNTLNSSVDKAKANINSGLANIESQATDKLDKFAEYREEAMEQASELYAKSEKYIRQNPFYFIGGAAVLGCVVGALLARKSS